MNEEFNERGIPKFDKEIQKKISEDFLNRTLPRYGITMEEFEEFKRKIKSGEIQVDNDDEI